MGKAKKKVYPAGSLGPRPQNQYGQMNLSRTKLQFFLDTYLRPVWAAVAILLTLVGGLVLVRDEFVLVGTPEATQTKLRLISVLAYIPFRAGTWFLLTAVVLVIYLFAMSWRHHRKLTGYIDQLEDRLKPRLEIVVGGEEQRPYFQERIIRLPAGDFRQRTLRVGIRNLSNVVIPGVRVILEDIDPGRERIYPGHRLQVMDHAPVPGYIDLSPGDLPAAFFDIVSEAMPVAQSESSDILISYVAAIEDNALPLGEYRFTLRAGRCPDPC